MWAQIVSPAVLAAATSEDRWLVLGPTIVSALAGLGGVIAGGWLQGRSQRRDWLRDKRHAAYADLMYRFGRASDAAMTGMAAITGARKKDKKAIQRYVRKILWRRADRFNSSYDRMLLVSSKRTRDAAEDLYNAIRTIRMLPIYGADDGFDDAAAIPTWATDEESIGAELAARAMDFLEVALPEVGGESLGKDE